MIASSHQKIKNDYTSKYYVFTLFFKGIDYREYYYDNEGKPWYKEKTKYTFQKHCKLIKINFEELIKEAFKPSRVEYQLLLDPNYEE